MDKINLPQEILHNFFVYEKGNREMTFTQSRFIVMSSLEIMFPSSFHLVIMKIIFLGLSEIPFSYISKKFEFYVKCDPLCS
jgi:hypothetical protein